MNKKTKMWLGVGVVAAAAYYFWNKSQKDKATSTATSTTKSLVSADGIFANGSGTCDRNGRAGWTERQLSPQVRVCQSPDGYSMYRIANK